jgi:hypothetical protein
MEMSKRLSATMVLTLWMANNHGGILVRFPGGWWSWHGAPTDKYRNPIEHASTRTIKALVARGRMRFIDWSRNRSVPTVVQVTNMDGTLNRGEDKD